MDTVTRFLAECCEFGDGFEDKTGDLYEAYAKWCNQQGEPLEEKVTLAKLLGRRTDLQQEKVGGERGWRGIKLKNKHPTSRCLRGA